MSRVSHLLLLVCGATIGAFAAQDAATHTATSPKGMDQAALTWPVSHQPLAAALQALRIRLLSDAPECRKHDLVGLHRQGSRQIILCTQRIRAITLNEVDHAALLQATLTHEAVHVAQFCKLERSGNQSLGIPAAKLYALQQSALLDVENSVKYGLSDMPRWRAWRQEAEATYLEDKPAQVVALLRRHCRVSRPFYLFGERPSLG